MGKFFRSKTSRYGLAIALFLITIGISVLLLQFSIKLNLTILVMGVIAVASWYGGFGPGLLLSLLIGATTVIFNPVPPDSTVAKVAFGHFSVTIFMISFALLISGRRKVENRLREQRELLQVTLKSIGDAVIATDTNGVINFINPTAEALTGWTEKEAVGQPLDEVFQIVSEETHERIENPFSSIKRDNAVEIANHTALVSRNGDKIPIQNSGSPIKDTNGTMVGVVIVFHDVSQRRQAEKEREQLLESERAARAEAETASRLKDDFLATVSHELRSPLSAILGWATMLNKGKLEEEATRSALATIERNARAQAGIVNDILDVSRIINGKLQINSKPVKIHALISEAIETLRPAAIAKSISLSVALDEIENPVIGDSNRLRQVVWNLVSNAIKFTPENGRVEINLKQIGSQAEIKVSDNGAGIDEQFLPFVFERFRQNDSSTTRAHGGLGLGLSIVRHLIELHGGTVTAESAGAGHGAAFTVHLPLAETVDAAFHQSNPKISKEFSADAPDIRGLRVLIVDDDTDTLEILRVVLKQYGARVRIAVSTADAMEVFHEWKPDVLISDLAMPVEDGYALIGKIRALSPEQGGNIPAAALTAYAAETDRRKSHAAGYQIHLAKPVDPAAIAAAVAEIKRKFN